MTNSHAAKVQQVYSLMNDLGVSIDDLELYGCVENRGDEVVGGTNAAFDRLIEDGFSLGESRYIEHYVQATSDYVSQALEERALINTGEWRVVIESMNEEYLYEFEEDGEREDAVQHAYALAVKEDGLDPSALWSVKSVEAI